MLTIPEDFVFDKDLEDTYRLMEDGASLFVTGRAGTGKSTLLSYFRKHSPKQIVVLAPTGLAALQVGGGTIHSFFGFPLRPILRNDPEIRAWKKFHPRLKVLQEMDTLIIDEVSMVRVDIMDAIDQMMRINLKTNLPFGGKQVILFGDMYQLAPVVARDESLSLVEYPDPWFFSAHAFKEQQFRRIELKKIYRQRDEDFIYLLNRVRNGAADKDDLAELNRRYRTESVDQDFTIHLTSTNGMADVENQRRLRALDTPEFAYQGAVAKDFPEYLFPASNLLRLKVGSQVMMIKNDLTEGRWVNGSIGKVERLSPAEIVVGFADGNSHAVKPVIWENKRYTWDAGAHTISFDVLGTYTQYPIRLAWAVTIHKSQGLTFDNVVIDLGRGAFSHGQLYVALSRCRSLEGITLRTKIRLEDMIVDEAVRGFR
jgi:ATP-dependent DNA helicase PIF1